MTRSKGNVIYEIDVETCHGGTEGVSARQLSIRRSRLDALRHIACALFQGAPSYMR